MSDKTKIEWSDATWNPVTGCSKVSEGCRNCYALKFSERFRGIPGHYFENGFDLTLRPDKLDQPLKWRRPRRIFVNSMSDLFHPDIPDDFIEEVFAIMSVTPQHTYQILTKRPERMLKWFTSNRSMFVAGAAQEMGYRWLLPDIPMREWWPLKNVWLGVSVENQKAADERIPLLLQTPAAVRFLSCEPLLGQVNLEKGMSLDGGIGCFPLQVTPQTLSEIEVFGKIDWVIAGGESGPGARPMHPEWARRLRDQCRAAGVSFFFKQWGEWADYTNEVKSKMRVEDRIIGLDGRAVIPESFGAAWMFKVGKHKAGRLLDGRTWDEIPGEVPAHAAT